LFLREISRGLGWRGRPRCVSGQLCGLFRRVSDHRSNGDALSRDLKVLGGCDDRIFSLPRDAAARTAHRLLVARLCVMSLLALGERANATGGMDRQALSPVRSRHPPVGRTRRSRWNGGSPSPWISQASKFPEHYHRWGVAGGDPVRWCWVTDPNHKPLQMADANKDFKQADGRVVRYPTQASTPAGDWLRKNPRIQPLGQVSLDFRKADARPWRPKMSGSRNRRSTCGGRHYQPLRD